MHSNQKDLPLNKQKQYYFITTPNYYEPCTVLKKKQTTFSKTKEQIMLNHQWVKPLLSMGATIIMCALVNACQNIKAADTSETISDTQVTEYSSQHNTNKHQIHIRSNNNEHYYQVDGKRFSHAQLTNEQKEKVNRFEKKLDKLEVALELDSERIEQWSEKMEQIAEEMELEAEFFEDALGDLEFESLRSKEFSSKMSELSFKLETKMSELEEKMRDMEMQMPKINQQKISEIEAQSEELKMLLIEISKSI